jgi:hypothetical protein
MEGLTMKPDVMTPAHPHWPRFCGELMGMVGPEDCEHHNRSATAAILRDLGCDVSASLEALAELGGCCCDCEVIMNAIMKAMPDHD